MEYLTLCIKKRLKIAFFPTSLIHQVNSTIFVISLIIKICVTYSTDKLHSRPQHFKCCVKKFYHKRYVNDR